MIIGNKSLQLLRVGDSFADPPAEWATLAKNREYIDATLDVVGKVRVLDENQRSWRATGFLVGPGLFLTARFVVNTLVNGLGDAQLELKPGTEVLFVSPTQITLPVNEVRIVHPFYEVALCHLDVESLLSSIPATHAKRKLALFGLPLASTAIDNLIDREVVAIGYPMGGDQAVMPGRITGYMQNDLGIKALLHDCATQGGVTGAPLIDVETGHVLGVHYAGDRQLQANLAVPAWELARDTRLRRHGVYFTDDPEWAHWWTLSEQVPSQRLGQLLPRNPGETTWNSLVDDGGAKSTAKDVQFEIAGKHFEHKELLALARLLKKAGFTSSDKIDSLLFGMDDEFKSTLPENGAPADRLLKLIGELNEVGTLTTGELPIETFLLNAVENSKPRAESAELAKYLERVRVQS